MGRVQARRDLRGLLVGLMLVGAAVAAEVDYAADVAFALDAIAEKAGHFFELKGIAWDEVRATFTAEAAKVTTPSEHLVLLTRLLARLEDGHAAVLEGPAPREAAWPREGPYAMPSDPGGCGIFLCSVGQRTFIKAAWGGAASGGVQAGAEVVRIDDVPAAEWFARTIARLRETQSFSTDHQAEYFASHWGLAGERGSRLTLDLKQKNKKKSVTLTRGNESVVAVGPVVPPPDLETIDRLAYGTSPHGFGYVHLRDIPEDLPDKMDTILGHLDDPPGLILDFRANGGGGCDHDALLGAFVPAGKTMPRAEAAPIPSHGAHPYGGPVVVIVDAGVRSAGETAAGMFKEDGRGYLIGESPTAGMSSQKETIALPSGLFELRISVASNKRRFNQGRGIEGIGVPPNEVVTYDPKDLAEGVDTLIRRAEELLVRFPKESVAYDPAEYGWRAKPRKK